MNVKSSTVTLLITTRPNVYSSCAALANHPVAIRQPEDVTWLQWHESRLVLIDDHDTEAVITRDLPNRDRIIVITHGQPDSNAWSHAEHLRAEQVVVLPDGDDYLDQLIALASTPGALTVAVVGPPKLSADIAAALAVAAAEVGLATALLELRTAPSEPMESRIANNATALPIHQRGDIVGLTPGARGQVPADILARTLARLAMSREVIIIDCAEADDPASILALNAADEVIHLGGLTGT